MNYLYKAVFVIPATLSLSAPLTVISVTNLTLSHDSHPRSGMPHWDQEDRTADCHPYGLITAPWMSSRKSAPYCPCPRCPARGRHRVGVTLEGNQVRGWQGNWRGAGRKWSTGTCYRNIVLMSYLSVSPRAHHTVRIWQHS